MNLTPEQLVNNLYTASRIANLPAEQHEILKSNAEELLVILAKLNTSPVATTSVAE